MVRREGKRSEMMGVKIGHAFDRRGVSEGCSVIWVKKWGRTGQEATIVIAMVVVRRGERNWRGSFQAGRRRNDRWIKIATLITVRWVSAVGRDDVKILCCRAGLFEWQQMQTGAKYLLGRYLII